MVTGRAGGALGCLGRPLEFSSELCLAHLRSRVWDQGSDARLSSQEMMKLVQCPLRRPSGWDWTHVARFSGPPSWEASVSIPRPRKRTEALRY